MKIFPESYDNAQLVWHVYNRFACYNVHFAPHQILNCTDNAHQIFERKRNCFRVEMVDNVKVCYTFQIEGADTKFSIDFEEGEKDIFSKPSCIKPEVRITMTEENILTMHIWELSTTAAFRSSKLKFFGELSKALTLKSVSKVTNEKSEATR